MPGPLTTSTWIAGEALASPASTFWRPKSLVSIRVQSGSAHAALMMWSRPRTRARRGVLGPSPTSTSFRRTPRGHHAPPATPIWNGPGSTTTRIGTITGPSAQAVGDRLRQVERVLILDRSAADVVTQRVAERLRPRMSTRLTSASTPGITAAYVDVCPRLRAPDRPSSKPSDVTVRRSIDPSHHAAVACGSREIYRESLESFGDVDRAHVVRVPHRAGRRSDRVRGHGVRAPACRRCSPRARPRRT